jgi:hypothetical protein
MHSWKSSISLCIYQGCRWVDGSVLTMILLTVRKSYQRCDLKTFAEKREISYTGFMGGEVIQIKTRLRSCMGQTRMSKMTLRAKQRPIGESGKSSEAKPESTSLISLQTLFQIFKKGRAVRSKFVESHLDKSIAYQIRSLREHPNNVSARLENPYYGKWSISTLKQIAAACDVVLVVWFIPFGRFLKWVTGTPYTDNGLSDDFYNIPTFADEFELASVPVEKMRPQSTRDEREFDSAFKYAQADDKDNPAQCAAQSA